MSDAVDDAQVSEALALKVALDAQAARIAEAFAPRDPTVANYCIDCGGAIEPERLRVLRSTARCAECAHTFERGLRE